MRRVVRKLDSDFAHKGDVDHSAAMSAFKGLTPTYGDFESKFGEMPDAHPILKRAMMRIGNHGYPYPNNMWAIYSWRI